MLSLGALAFTNPYVLLGFLALPGLWFLVRALPPQPRLQAFPPLRLMRDLAPSEPPQARTPLWLLLLRFLLLSLFLLAMAGPVLNPQDRQLGSGALLILLDDGWQAASRWEDRRTLLDRILARAAREDRSVLFVPTAPPVGGIRDDTPSETIEPVPAEDFRRRLAGIEPKPFSPDHRWAARRLRDLPVEIAQAIWVSDGLRHDGTDTLHAAFKDLPEPTLYTDADENGPLALLPVEQIGRDLEVHITRIPNQLPEERLIAAESADGRRLGEAVARFDENANLASALISLPRDLRNQVARIAIAGEKSAGAVYLFDARSARPLVGLSAGAVSATVQPLKSPLFYLRRALEPYADLADGDVEQLLRRSPGALILADVGNLTPQLERRLLDWIDKGGLLIRFAGPNMAESGDGLLPVRLRSGARAVGGALSWEEPQMLAPFEAGSPFVGLAIPEDVTIKRQLLAAPDIDLADKAWARLSDGTPLVTAARQGRGHLVLVHTTANADWSNLVLSGLFVDMLKRMITFAQLPEEARFQSSDGPQTLVPQQLLSGRGELLPATQAARPIDVKNFAKTTASPVHPAGLYGSVAYPFALNLMQDAGPVSPSFRFQAHGYESEALQKGAVRERDLMPPLLGLMLLLVLADLTASLFMRGYLSFARLRSPLSLFLCLGTFLFSLADTTISQQVAGAQAATQQERVDDTFATQATASTRIAYVLTGDPELDARSHAALYGIGRVLDLRTAVQLGDPIGVRPGKDPLRLFPFLYWPVPSNVTALEPDALLALRRFLRNGGIVLMDTGVNDGAENGIGIENPASRRALQRMLGGFDLPPLVPVDQDHVLARSFYLLDGFPGRLSGRSLWVSEGSFGEEAEVSPILIGSHDWASAWAIDEFDHFLVQRLPGGARQRELAFRFGVNLVMYALTGTYKADQLHLPALIERLGE